MIPDDLAQVVVRVFPRYAKAYAYYVDLDPDELADEMHLILVEEGASVVHKCGPLLSQKPAYIATWAARCATKRLKRQWQVDYLDEKDAAPEPTIKGGDFAEYLERIGAEWGIDVSVALDAIGTDEVSPAFEQYIRELGPKDRRIAALLLSGLKRSHISEQHLAPRPRTKRIHHELYQVLKKAA